MLASWTKCIFVIGTVFVNTIVANGPQYQSESIDTLAQKYLDVERDLWLLVRSTDLYDNDNTLIHLYETHEDFLGRYFSETGIFDRLLTEQRLQILEENRIMERHTWHMVDSIKYINVTALNTYRFLNHRQYDQMAHMTEEICEIMPKMIGTLRRYVTKQFWSYVRFVSVNQL